jgi:cytochrome c6
MKRHQHAVGVGILVSLLLLIGLVAPAAWAADPQKGGKLYTKNCKSCHGADGMGQMPGLPDFRRGEGLMRSDNDLLQFIRNGSGMMPAYRGLLSDRDILDVISYLRTLRR